MNRYASALASVPDDAVAHGVRAEPTVLAGRAAVRVELSTDAADGGVPGRDFVDQPTFLVIPVSFSDGTIEVDLSSRLNGRGLPDSRAFAGIAYRISAALDSFEAVYLRPLNGRRLNPGPPRDRRAVQHFTYPNWPFDRLREAFPDGEYEAGADIAPDEWTHLRLAIHGARCEVIVDDQPVLVVERSTAEPATGAIGLFVDTGSEAFFADLVIRAER